MGTAASAAKARAAKAAKKDPELKRLRPAQYGVREASNVRMIVMAQPICPVVEDPEDPKFTGESNCQREGLGWWTLCEERGHDPYYSSRETIKKEPVLDEEGFVVKERQRVIKEHKLNVTRVAKYTRINAGRGPEIAHTRKGFRFLPEMGFEPVCEYRGCELPVKTKSRYGNFCGERHARLIGMDVEGQVMPIKSSGSVDWEEITSNPAVNIAPLEGGAQKIQQPPDVGA